MAIIYSYPYVSTVNNSDTLVISVSDTTADNGFLTKSLTADNLASYVTARVNLQFSGDTGSGVINLDTQSFTISGTTNEIETSANSQILQIGLPDNVTITNNLTIGGDFTGDRGTFTGDLNTTDDLQVGGETETNTLAVNTTASIGGALSMTLNNINNVANPVAAQDAATKAYVDDLISGGLSFRGSFRADTGEILSGANTGSYLYNCPGGAGTRVSVIIGDYYIVANTGGQFYCSGDLLNIGDSIMAVADAPADSSTINDWATIESDSVEGTGIANTVPLWTDSQVIGNSNITQTPGGSIVMSENLLVDQKEIEAGTMIIGGTAQISGELDKDGTKIVGLADPTAAQDATTKTYVDSADAVNAANIATNTSNISTNTSNISSNTTAIGTKVNGSGTTNYISKWSNSNTLTDSIIYENFASVGIGTDTPSERLHVDGNVTAGKYFGLGSTEFYVDPNDSTASAILNGSVGINITPAPTPTQKLHVGGNVTADKYYGNGSTEFYLDPNDSTISAVLNGDVGINITPAPVPTQKLHVGGNVTADRYYGNGSTDFYVDPNDGTTSALLNGSVGINIGTSPTEQLHVGGNITADRYYGNGSTAYYVDPNDATQSAILNGSVGIGRPSPGAKLDVNGGVRVAEDQSAASALNVGTLRYRTSGNNSYVDMCMQTGASTYDWVNIVQNNW